MNLLLRRGFHWTAIACVVAAAYVLSAGPAAWFVDNTGIGEGLFCFFYSPLDGFAHTPFGKGIDDYVHLFNKRGFPNGSL